MTRTSARLLLLLCCILIRTLVAGAAQEVALADQTPPSLLDALVVQPESDQPQGEIDRGYFELALTPGESREIRLAMKNVGPSPFSLEIYPVDGVQSDGGIDYTVAGKPLAGVGSWIKVVPERIEIAPGETRRITATVRPPIGTAGGEFVGGIAVEDTRSGAPSSSSQILIGLHYRRVIAVVATLPGVSAPKLQVNGVSLLPGPSGTRVVVDLQNRGNVVLKGKGDLEIAGAPGETRTIPFAVPSLLPGGQEQLGLDLPELTLKPGAYDTRVDLVSEDGQPLDHWQASVPLQVASVTPTAAPPGPVILDPAHLTTETKRAAAGGGGLSVTFVALLGLVGGVALGLSVIIWRGRRCTEEDAK